MRTRAKGNTIRMPNRAIRAFHGNFHFELGHDARENTKIHRNQ